MPLFQKKAQVVKSPTQPLRSKANAPSSATPKDVQKAVADKVAQVVRKRKPKKGLFSVSLNERLFFLDNLATLLKAGMPLSGALGTLSSEARSRVMRRGLVSVKHIVDNGGQLSEALKEHPEIFSPLYIAVVEVGEAGGSLAEVLERLAETSKKSKALRSKMINALIYPIVVIVAIIGVVTVLMIYVFPQLIAIFEEVDVELPLQTRILIGTVDFLEAYGLYVLGGGFAIIALMLFTKKIRSVHRMYHLVIMRLGILGRVWREIVLVRTLGNLRMLLISGVPIVQAFTISSRTAGNLVYEDALRDVAKDLERGKAISEVLGARPKLFPSLVTSMTRVGEETGKFDEILGKLEEYYERRVENVFANLSSIIEPVLLISIGIVVGFIAVSVIMPIYNLAQSF